MFNAKFFSLICLLIFAFLSSCVGSNSSEEPSASAAESVEISQSDDISEASSEEEPFISDIFEESEEKTSDSAVSLPFIPFD